MQACDSKEVWSSQRAFRLVTELMKISSKSSLFNRRIIAHWIALRLSGESFRDPLIELYRRRLRKSSWSSRPNVKLLRLSARESNKGLLRKRVLVCWWNSVWVNPRPSPNRWPPNFFSKEKSSRGEESVCHPSEEASEGVADLNLAVLEDVEISPEESRVSLQEAVGIGTGGVSIGRGGSGMQPLTPEERVPWTSSGDVTIIWRDQVSVEVCFFLQTMTIEEGSWCCSQMWDQIVFGDGRGIVKIQAQT